MSMIKGVMMRARDFFVRRDLLKANIACQTIEPMWTFVSAQFDRDLETTKRDALVKSAQTESDHKMKTDNTKVLFQF